METLSFVRVSHLRGFALAGGLESEFQVMALKAVKLAAGQDALKHRHMPLVTHLPERKLRGTAHAIVGVDQATEYCFEGSGIAECTQRLHARVADQWVRVGEAGEEKVQGEQGAPLAQNCEHCGAAQHIEGRELRAEDVLYRCIELDKKRAHILPSFSALLQHANQSKNIIIAYAHAAVNSEERFFG